MNNNLVLHDLFHDSFFPHRWNSIFPRSWNRTRQSSCCDPSACCDPYDTKAYEIQEKDDEYQIDLDIPGVSKDNLKVEVKDNQLQIRTEYAKDENESRERRSYNLSFTIPANVEKQNIQVELKQGVLRVTLPKREEEKAKLLEITEVA